MLNFLKGNQQHDYTLRSPVEGTCVALAEVPDDVFANKIMGDGVAFVWEDDIVYSPCTGSIVTIASTRHAIGIKSHSGIEMLIHVGLDTVELAGKGFEVLVELRQKVRVGTPLLKIDRQVMKEHQINLITPLIITNSDHYRLTLNHVGQKVERGKSVVIECTKLPL